jgi:NTP pyrophosphatase (non-canonical NTP hydrolase)
MNKNDLPPVILQEECAEVIQAISKVYRFGMDQLHPETGVSNRNALQTELGQLAYMIEYIVDVHWHLDKIAVHEAYLAKGKSLHKWSKYFPDEDDHNKYADPKWLKKTGLL